VLELLVLYRVDRVDRAVTLLKFSTYKIFKTGSRQGKLGLWSKGLTVGGLALVTFDVEGDPDPVGAGAEPFAVQDGLGHCHGQRRALA
jgi:hypothetical protein